MLLVSAKIGPFKSIEKPEEVKIEEGVTVLVGMNESGKTVFLEALQKSDDIFDLAKFIPIDDYPRKNLSFYERRHETLPDTATVLTYEITDKEADAINKSLHTQLPSKFRFSIHHYYDNRKNISLQVDPKAVIAELAKQADLSSEFRDAISKVSLFGEIPKAVEGLSLTDADKQCLTSVNQRVETAQNANWSDTISYEVLQQLTPRTPKFMYFGDYEVLPSKMNLADLANVSRRRNQIPLRSHPSTEASWHFLGWQIFRLMLSLNPAQ